MTRPSLDIMSDLHIDLRPDYQVNQFLVAYRRHVLDRGAPNYIFVAGDTCTYRRPELRNTFLKNLRDAADGAPLIEIPGNHDFWNSNVMPADIAVEQMHDSKVKVLAGTGWFPDKANWFEHKEWIDFRKIGTNKPDTITSISRAHDIFCKYLAENEAEIVMTHHFPLESVTGKWVGEETNKFFAADFASVVAKAPVKPKLWIHGHTHDPHDYVHPLGFRVYCNPYGYEGEGANPYFWSRLRIDL